MGVRRSQVRPTSAYACPTHAYTIVEEYLLRDLSACDHARKQARNTPATVDALIQGVAAHQTKKKQPGSTIPASWDGTGINEMPKGGVAPTCAEVALLQLLTSSNRPEWTLCWRGVAGGPCLDC